MKNSWRKALFSVLTLTPMLSPLAWGSPKNLSPLAEVLKLKIELASGTPTRQNLVQKGLLGIELNSLHRAQKDQEQALETMEELERYGESIQELSSSSLFGQETLVIDVFKYGRMEVELKLRKILSTGEIQQFDPNLYQEILGKLEIAPQWDVTSKFLEIFIKGGDESINPHIVAELGDLRKQQQNYVPLEIYNLGNQEISFEMTPLCLGGMLKKTLTGIGDQLSKGCVPLRDYQAMANGARNGQWQTDSFESYHDVAAILGHWKMEEI